MTVAFRLEVLAAALLAGGLAYGAVKLYQARLEAEAARQEAVSEAAQAAGARRITEARLTAASAENAALQARLERMTKAGGKVTGHVQLVSGTGTVGIPWQGPLPEGADAPPPQPVKIGPATVECGVVDQRWWGCTDVDVLVTPPGERVHLPLDLELSKIEFASEVMPAQAHKPRTLIGLDAGLVGDLNGIGWELGGRAYPARWAFTARWAEGRIGGYLRTSQVPGGTQAAGGVSVLFGVGKR